MPPSVTFADSSERASPANGRETAVLQLQVCHITHTKEFISKVPSPSPSPSRGEGCNISPPLRGGDEGEGDVCGFTNDRISKST